MCISRKKKNHFKTMTFSHCNIGCSWIPRNSWPARHQRTQSECLHFWLQLHSSVIKPALLITVFALWNDVINVSALSLSAGLSRSWWFKGRDRSCWVQGLLLLLFCFCSITKNIIQYCRWVECGEPNKKGSSSWWIPLSLGWVWCSRRGWCSWTNGAYLCT